MQEPQYNMQVPQYNINQTTPNEPSLPEVQVPANLEAATGAQGLGEMSKSFDEASGTAEQLAQMQQDRINTTTVLKGINDYRDELDGLVSKYTALKGNQALNAKEQFYAERAALNKKYVDSMQNNAQRLALTRLMGDDQHSSMMTIVQHVAQQHDIADTSNVNTSISQAITDAYKDPSKIEDGAKKINDVLTSLYYDNKYGNGASAAVLTDRYYKPVYANALANAIVNNDYDGAKKFLDKGAQYIEAPQKEQVAKFIEQKEDADLIQKMTNDSNYRGSNGYLSFKKGKDAIEAAYHNDSVRASNLLQRWDVAVHQSYHPK